MDYNEYDSNGNKKKINFSSLFSDKTNRSRLILLLYLILFVGLVVFVRNSGETNSTNNTNTNKDNNEIVEDDIVEESDNEFSYLFLNNYNFEFNITLNEKSYQIVGKRYNDNYEFDLIEEETTKYIGSSYNMYAKKENEENYTKASLPIPIIDCFDNVLLKEIITASKKIKDYYEINNNELNNIISSDEYYASNTEKTNIIKLDIKNNKIVGIDIDYSNIANEWDEEITIAKINLKYSNFGLIDDFSINIE